jgi:hypothetical protein
MDGRCRFTGARSVAEIFLRRRLNVTAAAHGVCEHLRRRGVEKRWRRGYYFLFHPSDAVDSNANGFVITSTQNARSEKLLYRSLAGKRAQNRSLTPSFPPAAAPTFLALVPPCSHHQAIPHVKMAPPQTRNAPDTGPLPVVRTPSRAPSSPSPKLLLNSPHTLPEETEATKNMVRLSRSSAADSQHLCVVGALRIAGAESSAVRRLLQNSCPPGEDALTLRRWPPARAGSWRRRDQRWMKKCRGRWRTRTVSCVGPPRRTLPTPVSVHREGRCSTGGCAAAGGGRVAGAGPVAGGGRGAQRVGGCAAAGARELDGGRWRGKREDKAGPHISVCG